MSDGVNTLDTAAIRARCDAARDMVRRLCLPRGNIEHRDWLMSIPADEARDPDLLIAAALADVPALLDALAAVEAENARLREQLTTIRHYAVMGGDTAAMYAAAGQIGSAYRQAKETLADILEDAALAEAAPATREE